METLMVTREAIDSMIKTIKQLKLNLSIAKSLYVKRRDEAIMYRNEVIKYRDELSHHKALLNEKYSEINNLCDKVRELEYCVHDLEIISENNPANFCGNCAHYAQMGKDDDEFEGICVQHYIKRVDPDDASCKHFKSNQVERDKPEQPCCDACNRDDCSKCNLCPF